jgi:hypothetical protein
MWKGFAMRACVGRHGCHHHRNNPLLTFAPSGLLVLHPSAVILAISSFFVRFSLLLAISSLSILLLCDSCSLYVFITTCPVLSLHVVVMVLSLPMVRIVQGMPFAVSHRVAPFPLTFYTYMHTQPLGQPSFHPPTKVCVIPVPPDMTYAEHRLKLVIKHTNVTMTATV